MCGPLCTILLATPVAAQSSPPVAVEAAYTVVHRTDFTCQGWNVAVPISVAGAVSLVGEISRVSKTDIVSRQFAAPLEYWTAHTTFAGGFRVGRADRGMPDYASAYIQFLVGRLDAESTLDGRSIVDFPDKAFLLQPGAGFAVSVTRRLRAFAQADYRHALFADASFNYLRGLVGLRLVLR
jgi:hypothetical protein